MATGGERLYRAKPREFYQLWMLAAATYAVGDTVTTISFVLFPVPGGEANPVLRAAIYEYGLVGLIVIKLVAFGIGIFVSWIAADVKLHPVVYYAPPALFAVVGAYLTISNLLGIFATAGYF